MLPNFWKILDLCIFTFLRNLFKKFLIFEILDTLKFFLFVRINSNYFYRSIVIVKRYCSKCFLEYEIKCAVQVRYQFYRFATVNPRFDHERKISSFLLYTTAKEDKRTDYRTIFPRDSIHIGASFCRTIYLFLTTILYHIWKIYWS